VTRAACAEIVRKGDPDRFLAAMAAPVEARAMLFPLYAFNVEVARAPYVSAEPMIGEMRLQWWRDAVEEIAAGKRPRAHEVVGPLAEVIDRAHLPVGLLDGIAAARRWDLWKEPFADEAAFRDHIAATSGNLMWATALALGAGARHEAGARAAGQAMGLANWFRAVPELEARGMYPLPDGRPEAVAALARAGLDVLATARHLSYGPVVPALRAAWQAGPILRQAAREPGRVAAGALGTSDFRRRLSLMWKAATGGW
jgi:phytoene/squalene synthetase